MKPCYIDIDKSIVVTDTRGRKRETTVRHILDFNKGTYEAADVQSVRHGRWKYEEKELKSGVVACLHACSVCGYRTNLFVINTIARTPYYFCPNCGAKMDGET